MRVSKTTPFFWPSFSISVSACRMGPNLTRLWRAGQSCFVQKKVVGLCTLHHLTGILGVVEMAGQLRATVWRSQPPAPSTAAQPCRVESGNLGKLGSRVAWGVGAQCKQQRRRCSLPPHLPFHSPSWPPCWPIVQGRSPMTTVHGMNITTTSSSVLQSHFSFALSAFCFYFAPKRTHSARASCHCLFRPSN